MLNYKWIETFIWIPAIFCFTFRIMHFQPYFIIIPGVITIIAFQFYFKSQLSLSVLKRVLSTFRVSVSIISLIIVVICDTARLYIHHSGKTYIIVTVIDIIIYISLCGGFVILDATKNITRFTRFFAPVLLVLVSVQNLISLETHAVGWEDTIIFTHQNIPISLKTIESAAIVQIILFCTSLIWNVFTDWKREYFWNLKELIPRKQSFITLSKRFNKAQENISQIGLPLLISNISETDTTKSSNKSSIENSTESTVSISSSERTDMLTYVKNGCNYIIIVIVGLAELFFFLSDINYIIPISILCAIQIMAIIILLKNNLDFEIGFIEIGKQFRVWMLSVSIFTIFILAGMDMYFDYRNKDNVMMKSDICGFIETLLYCNTVLLGIVRDGMIYPLAFHILLPIIILIPTYYSIYSSLFLWTYKPFWYLYILRTAFIQIALLMQLLLYSVWKDPSHQYFTLILKKQCRNDLFKTSKKDNHNNKIHININDIEFNMQEIIWSDKEQSPVSLSLSIGSSNSNVSD